MQSSIEMSRPPSPPMKLTIAGRFLAGTGTSGTSCIRMPPESGEPWAKSRSTDPTRLEAAQALAQFDRREGPEPAQVDVAYLLSLVPETADCGARGHRHGPQADQHDFGVVGHELGEVRA